MPGPVPVGDDRHADRRVRSVEQLVELGRLHERRVARHEQHPLEALGDRVADADLRGRRLARLRVVVSTTIRSPRATEPRPRRR